MLEKFRLRQPVSESGQMIRSVGPFVKVTPFSEFGRRTVTLNAGPQDDPRDPGDHRADAPLDPGPRRVRDYVWDMRIATSSIRPDGAGEDPRQAGRRGGIDQRRRIARVLRAVRAVRRGRQRSRGDSRRQPRRRRTQEAARARAQGRSTRPAPSSCSRSCRSGARPASTGWSWRRSKKFPEKGTAAETLQAVREMTRRVREARGRAQGRAGTVRRAAGQGRPTQALRKQLAPIREEIAAELNFNTLGRMAAFREMADDASISPQDKLALAISGWLLGQPGRRRRSFSTALSLVRLRDLIRKYLAAPDKVVRDRDPQGVRLGGRGHSGHGGAAAGQHEAARGDAAPRGRRGAAL